MDGEQPSRLLSDLADWVCWLTTTFRVAEQLPDCWMLHSDLTEELIALRAARAGAYTKDASAGQGLQWLYDLDRARDRWVRWNVSKCKCKCKYSTHAPSNHGAEVVHRVDNHELPKTVWDPVAHHWRTAT